MLSEYDMIGRTFGGLANITVTNPISLNSLFFHIPAKVGINNPTKGQMKTIHQTLHITTVDPCLSQVLP